MGVPTRASLPPIEVLHRDQVIPFVAGAGVGLLLIGTAPRHSFLVPILRHVRARCGEQARFAYAPLPELQDRAFLLRPLRPALGRRRRPLRAARCGYYLVAAGRPVAFHPGLHDPRHDWAPIQAQADGGAWPGGEALGGEPAPLRAFRQIAQQAARDVIERFEPLLALACAASEAQLRALRVLGLSPGASAADIKAAYRREMLRCHPDRAAAQAEPPPPERAQEVTTAYRILARGPLPEAALPAAEDLGFR